MQMSIDYKNGTVHFGGYQLESERMREQIANLAKRLSKVASLINPEPPVDYLSKRKEVRAPADSLILHAMICICPLKHNVLPAFFNHSLS